MAWQENLSPVDVLREDATLKNKVFCVTTNDITSGAVGGAETAQFLISNPSNSNKRMKIYQITLGTNVSTNNNIFRMYANPTVTSNGTSLTPVCLHVDGQSTASSINVYKVPTVSANGSLMMNYIAPATSTVVIPCNHKIIIEKGQKLLITVRPNTTGVTYSINCFWIEEE